MTTSTHAHGPAGLAIAEGGLVLAPEATRLPLDREAELAFRIVGPDGEAIQDLQVEHERELHLIVVRRDLTGYQHLHPESDESGRWSGRLRLPEAGVYRAYADFRLDGRPYTLATDLFVDGPLRSRAVPPPRPAQEAEGYAVELSGDGAAAAGGVELAYDIARGGEPVDRLEPHLGADGHLVALREGDLAYLHVHPEGSPASGRIAFHAAFPSAGRYRLFLQFRHGGRVRTVAHTLDVAG